MWSTGLEPRVRAHRFNASLFAGAEMAWQIHGVVQKTKHFDDIARAARGDAKHDEVPTFAALARHVQAEQSLENLIARFGAEYVWTFREGQQRHRKRFGVHECLCI